VVHAGVLPGALLLPLQTTQSECGPAQSTLCFWCRCALYAIRSTAGFLAYLLERIRLSDRSCKSGICEEVWRLRSIRFKNSIWRSENLTAADRPNLTPPIDELGLCRVLE
jgi:hypothetical protein